MSKTSKKVIIGVLAAGLVCTAGWFIIREYSMGQGFVPSDFTQELRTNQVLFSGEQSSSKSTPGDGEQDSSLLERDESGDNQQDPMGQDGANFLFEGGRLPQDLAAGTISMGGSTDSDAGENQNGAGAGGTLPDRVFDVSGDSTGGGNTGGTIISGGGSGTTGGNTGGSVASTLPDPEPGKATRRWAIITELSASRFPREPVSRRMTTAMLWLRFISHSTTIPAATTYTADRA